MNMLLLNEEDFINADTVRISGRRFQQLTQVIGIAPGKILKAGILNRDCGEGVVSKIGEGCAEINYRATALPPAPAPLTLVIAMQRPQTFMKVLHGAISMGVKKIHFIHTFKVEKSYWQSSRLTDEALKEEITLALEQAADPVQPELFFHRRFKIFADDELENIAGNSIRLYGDPDGGAPSAATENVTLAIGPEGGFTDYETAVFREHGFSGISLGPRILRTEFALAALLGKLIL